MRISAVNDRIHRFGLVAAVLAVALVGLYWFTSRSDPHVPTTVSTEAPVNRGASEAHSAPLKLEVSEPERAAGTSVPAHSAPVVSETPAPNPADAKVILWGLEQFLEEYDRTPNWDVAQRLLIACITVDMDSKGLSIPQPAPETGIRPPAWDPDKCFLIGSDLRGSRWYHFTREQYPEWFDLTAPSPTDKITGTQDGPATFGKLAPELGARIRTLASVTLESNRPR